MRAILMLAVILALLGGPAVGLYYFTGEPGDRNPLVLFAGIASVLILAIIAFRAQIF